MTTIDQATDHPADHHAVRELDPDVVGAAIAKRSYAVLATVSPAGHPHAAGILYSTVGTTLYASTDRASRKGRNIAANGRVGLTIPVRRVPVGPPSAIHFQASARLLESADPEITALVERGELRTVTGHGELERAEACFVRIDPSRTVHTYGLGMSLWRLVREPLNAAGRTTVGAGVPPEPPPR